MLQLFSFNYLFIACVCGVSVCNGDTIKAVLLKLKIYVYDVNVVAYASTI